MFFTLKELVRWFGMTVFEVWVHLVSLLIASVLAVLKLEGDINTSWWVPFAPLFVADGLNTYFCVIVFIRHYRIDVLRPAGLRLLSSLLCNSLIFVYKFLMYSKLDGITTELRHTEVMAPLFPLLLIMAIRSCQAQGH